MNVHRWDELWSELRKGEVYPLPLATATRWTEQGWVVEVVMVQSISDTGYSTIPVFSYSEPADPILAKTPAEAARVTAAATAAFATRLGRALDSLTKSRFRRFLDGS